MHSKSSQFITHTSLKSQPKRFSQQLLGQHHVLYKVSVCYVFRTKAAVRSHDAAWVSTTRTTSCSLAFDLWSLQVQKLFTITKFLRPPHSVSQPHMQSWPTDQNSALCHPVSRVQRFHCRPEGITHKTCTANLPSDPCRSGRLPRSFNPNHLFWNK